MNKKYIDVRLPGDHYGRIFVDDVCAFWSTGEKLSVILLHNGKEITVAMDQIALVRIIDDLVNPMPGQVGFQNKQEL